tara:strand:- start:10774 stop:11505 length:732 start_codon:yes stop_codon:yes gene_type:complete
MKVHKKWLTKNKKDQTKENKDKFVFTNNHGCAFLKADFMSSLDSNSKLKMMEIGCQEGNVSIKLIKEYLRHSDSRMYCLDLFPPDKLGMERNFDHNISLLGDDASKVIKCSGPSWKSLRNLSTEENFESFDLIYVDGWHGAHGVLDDAVLSWKLLKVGGFLVFDDYSWSKAGMKDFRKPKLAIDSFIKIFKIFFNETKAGNQKCFKKTVSNDMEIRRCQEKGGSDELSSKYFVDLKEGDSYEQ